MAADRGTLTRGGTPSPDNHAWPQATAPSGRRPPSAPRERKPALAALALLLIIGGALAAAYLVIQNGHRVAAIEITQQVGAGQRIPLSAMREVEIAPGGVGYVAWSEAGQVAQFYAASVIPPGTLLTASMVTRSADLAAGRVVLGLALKDGQLPTGLLVGDRVAIYQVSNSAQACPGASGATLSPNAIVLGISAPPPSAGSAATDVRVAVYPGVAGAVACNAANGNVGIALLPPGRSLSRGAAAPSAPASPAGGAAGQSGRAGQGRHPRQSATPTAPSGRGSPSGQGSPSAPAPGGTG
jgi:hypothetical protein